MAQQATGSLYWKRLRESQDKLLPLREQIDRRRGPLVRSVEAAERWVAHPAFFAILIVTHVSWIVLNTRLVPWAPWDPYPFPLLAMIASVEAPIITVMVLMRQHRERQISELREEVEVQLSLHLERQASELVRMLDRIEGALGIREDDDEVRQRRRAMMEPLDPESVLDVVRERLEQDESERQPGR